MSKYFQTVREPVDVTVGDKTVTFWIRELGYLEFEELTQSTGRDLPKEKRGILIVGQLCVAAVETKEGEPAFSSITEWKREPKQVINTLIPEVLRVNGMKSDEIKKELTKEEIAGNELPSKRSGSSSPTLSAAPSGNLKIA